MLDSWEILLRLGVATVAGFVVGLNRNLHNKPAGSRTLGLVALGAGTVVIAGVDLSGPQGNLIPLGPIIQGIVTGIGFLGAGVIVHEWQDSRVIGLTTAVSIWLTASIGIVCGLGAWRHLGVTVALTALVLVFGGGLEKHFHKFWDRTFGLPPTDS
jgi:putative Mg2+ transporter-C (MgtC) family protein